MLFTITFTRRSVAKSGELACEAWSTQNNLATSAITVNAAVGWIFGGYIRRLTAQ